MRISISEAKNQLDELARRAEAGDEVVLTRTGRSDIRLVPEQPERPKLDKETRLKLIREIQQSAAAKVLPGPSAARSADFLYNDETGLPE